MSISRSFLGFAALICVLFVCTLTSVTFAQKATLTGTVTDEETGETLPGANVLVTAPGIQTGAASNSSGRFTVSNLPAGTYSVTVSYIGYEQRVFTDVTLAAGESKTLDVTLLLTGIEINPIAVTASRRPEKTLDAPASISVLEAREISTDVSTSSSSILRNVTGIDVAQTGVDRREIVLRGFNNAFSGEAYILTDNRQASVASLGVNIHSIMPNQSTDLERIEIVRGPGAALYGAGVDEGVIHYITKDPFTNPGTTFSFSGGERTSFAGQFRHAGVINNSVGYKITAQYAQADDWELNANDPLDATQLATDRPGVVRDYDYQKINVNGLLEFKISDDVTLTANGGHSQIDAIVLTGVGTAQADGWGYSYGQLRLQAGNFFAQTYLNRNNAGDSRVLSGPINKLVDKSTLFNVQAQYNLELAGGKHHVIFGFDYDRTTPDTEGTIYGRNEEVDLISETGGYVQAQVALGSKLDVTGALRLDYNNLQEDLVASPRVALVFKPTPQHSFRVTYNKAFTSPGNTENFLDIPAAQLPGTDIVVQGRGSAFGFHFARNSDFAALAGTDLVAYSLNPAALGQPQPVGLPLDATYAAVYAGLAAIPLPVIRSLLPPPLNDPNLVPDALIQGLITLLDPQFTQVSGFSKGALAKLNLATFGFDPVQDVDDIQELKINTTHSFEVGYKGLIENRVLFAIDGYYTRKKNFVGPLAMESPFVFVPTLSADLQAALATGIANNATLAATLGQVGQTPESVAALIVGLAGGDLPDATTPVAIVDPVEHLPDAGETPGLLLAYRNFGEVDFWGIDVSLQIIASERLSLFGNLSFVSDDLFDNEELDETNTALQVALNAPSFKTKFGFNYSVPLSFSVNASARYVQGFPVDSGVYVGDVDDYFLLDVGAGYDLGRYAPGARFDFLIQNLLDNDHREFIGAPKLGRFAMARLTYTIR